ncbi:receptor-like protein 14 isoform X6 [Helianthus annuus]|uniref:receptor-like protein 14 isoform X6 n=1 Tax=Helianthus annuus TaxID=4232 RepID=UPI001652E5D8|nr:receptor-like protein 14 isoform X6 [Helianthus annuus]
MHTPKLDIVRTILFPLFKSVPCDTNSALISLLCKKMGSWCLTKQSSFLILMMLLFSLVGWIQGIHIEDDRKALLEIKASLREASNFFDVDNLLPTWSDQGSTGGKYCEWERIKCDATSGHVTDLSLSNIFSLEDYHFERYRLRGMIWPLNVSLFLHFKELRKLDLSWSYIGNTFISTGLDRLSDLKKLEHLNLSYNYIDYNIFPSLSELTSLKILDLSNINNEYEEYSSTHDISDFRVPENLELLDLTGCGYYGTLQMQGSISTLRKLRILNLGGNRLNESIVKSLSALPSLKALDLGGNLFSGSFPLEGLCHLTSLEKLDLGGGNYSETPSIQACKCLMRLERLESVSLRGSMSNLLHLNLEGNEFSDDIMRSMAAFPSLIYLSLDYCSLGGRLFGNGTKLSNLVHLSLVEIEFNGDFMRSMVAFPSLRFLDLGYAGITGRLFGNVVPSIPNLQVLILNENHFSGPIPIEALVSFHRLEILDLSGNNFVGSIPSTIKFLSSLKALSFSFNSLNGSLTNGLCELKNLKQMDFSANMFDGNLPECFNRLSSLKFLDISRNQFTGKIPPSLIANLTSLEYVDFSHNKFEGLFSFSMFSNHRKLEFVSFKNDNDKFEVETEEPIGWIPMFQLKVLVLSNCNIKMPKRSSVPCFLLHQRKLKKLDLSHNSLEGMFPNWLIDNNRMLEVFNLRDNSFGNIFYMPLYRNPNTMWVDMSGNRMVGSIPRYMPKFFPHITYLNLSINSLDGVIPSSIGDLVELYELDLSHNKLSGEVPTGLLTNLSQLFVLNLSNNSLHGEVISTNLNLGDKGRLCLDNNYFTGKILHTWSMLELVDISNNFFTGFNPCWISNITTSFEPEGSLLFLDISQNSFSGPIPSCLISQSLEHLHLGSNKFTGSIPNSFGTLKNVLTLDIGNNYLSHMIPKFLGELSSLRILLLGKNNFSGSIPKQLCRLTNASLIDLSNNFLSGSIPSCLQNIRGPSYQAFMHTRYLDGYDTDGRWRNSPNFYYQSIITNRVTFREDLFKIKDEVLFTTKALSLTYKGDALDSMSGLDLSSNKLTGYIPEELGLLTHIHVLNLSHNKLTGPIPTKFSNLASIESLDLSFNNLSGKVPSELIKLNSLEVFNVSFNNLSGTLPMKAQFGTFSKESYEGNPLLCGPPLENKCTMETKETHPSIEEGDDVKWYDMDMTSFYGSFGSTWFVSMCGFATLLWVNPYWRRRWLELVEECMYTCYYFLYDSVRKVSMYLFK